MSRFKTPRSSLSGYTLTNADRRRRLGRVQRQIRRALIGLGRPLRIRDLLKWVYPHVVEFQSWHRTNIHRAITRVARPVGKTRKRFATTWRLHDTDL
jgi:hypothetical protein